MFEWLFDIRSNGLHEADGQARVSPTNVAICQNNPLPIRLHAQSQQAAVDGGNDCKRRLVHQHRDQRCRVHAARSRCEVWEDLPGIVDVNSANMIVRCHEMIYLWHIQGFHCTQCQNVMIPTTQNLPRTEAQHRPMRLLTDIITIGTIHVHVTEVPKDGNSIHAFHCHVLISAVHIDQGHLRKKGCWESIFSASRHDENNNLVNNHSHYDTTNQI